MASEPSERAGSPKRSSLAVWSLAMGLLGWSFFPIVGGVVAIVTGHLAWREISRSEGTVGGQGMATAGLVLGYSSAILGVILAAVAILYLLFVIAAEYVKYEIGS